MNHKQIYQNQSQKKYIENIAKYHQNHKKIVQFSTNDTTSSRSTMYRAAGKGGQEEDIGLVPQGLGQGARCLNLRHVL